MVFFLFKYFTLLKHLKLFKSFIFFKYFTIIYKLNIHFDKFLFFLLNILTFNIFQIKFNKILKKITIIIIVYNNIQLFLNNYFYYINDRLFGNLIWNLFIIKNSIYYYINL